MAVEQQSLEFLTWLVIMLYGPINNDKTNKAFHHVHINFVVYEEGTSCLRCQVLYF